jgi:GxxExxY protein
MQKKENDISYDIRGAAFKVHNALGPGLLESVYETALSYELRQLGYEVKNQIPVPMIYADKDGCRLSFRYSGK